MKVQWRNRGKESGIRGDEIHVWRADLDLFTGSEPALNETLSAEETGKAARFRSSRDRTRYAGSRLILRRVLAHYLGLPAQQIRFVRGFYGKPELDHEGENLRFSVSHSGRLLAIAVTRGSKVGVDVELVDENFPITPVAGKVLSRSELAELILQPPAVRATEFYAVWTRKEAYLKAIGVGISGINPDLAGGSVTSVFDPNDHGAAADAGGWSISPFEAGEGYIGAIAYCGAPKATHFWQWQF